MPAFHGELESGFPADPRQRTAGVEARDADEVLDELGGAAGEGGAVERSPPGGIGEIRIRSEDGDTNPSGFQMASRRRGVERAPAGGVNGITIRSRRGENGDDLSEAGCGGGVD